MTSHPASFNAFDLLDESTNQHIDVQEDHSTIVRDIGAAGAVLLKNSHHALPLKIGNDPGSLRSIVVVGMSIHPPAVIGFAKSRFPTVHVGNGAGPGSMGPNGFDDRGGADGVLAMGWGSGTAEFPYLITPLEAIQARARRGKTAREKATVSWWLNNWDLPGAQKAVAGYGAAVSIPENHLSHM